MPNSLSATGLTIATQSELQAQLIADYQSIYGSDIDLSSSTPDAQMMNIYIQALLDALQLTQQVYNSFDPDSAIGVVLDSRVTMNGIQRQAGTYTITPITLILAQSVNLYGVDQSAKPVYTVQDNAGTQWELQTTQLGIGPGTSVLNFQAALPGATQTIPNTITTAVTIVLGVSSVNNPSALLVLGLNEESDNALKIRRQKSVSFASAGYLAGLIAALDNISGMSFVQVYENVTDTPNGDGVPGHSIWVITAGSATAVDIATAIYQKRNAGCGMFGAQNYTITQADGSPFVVHWDVVITQALFIQFNVHGIDGINTPDITTLTDAIVANYTPGVYETVNINALATIVQAADPNALVTGAGFSLASLGPFTTTLTPSAKNNQFSIIAANISITVI
jgi:hypothetical protein